MVILPDSSNRYSDCVCEIGLQIGSFELGLLSQVETKKAGQPRMVRGRSRNSWEEEISRTDCGRSIS
jgi:hypothetical protein